MDFEQKKRRPGRPIFVAKGDVLNLVPLVELQRRRFETLVMFYDAISTPEMREALTLDDVGFKRFMEDACDEYGVQRKKLSKRLGNSAAAVGRWVKKDSSLPPPYGHVAILDAVRDIIREHIESERAREKENTEQGALTLLVGSVVS